MTPGPGTTRENLATWIANNLNEAEKSLAWREESARGWTEGTEAQWKAAAAMTGDKPLTRSEREAAAEADRRITPKAAHRVEMWKQTAALLAEVERLRWQPINTAPRDGAALLCCYADCEEPLTMVLSFNGKEWIADSAEAHDEPTHWMPLLEPPQALRAEGDGK